MLIYKCHVFLKHRLILLILVGLTPVYSYSNEYFPPELLMLGDSEKTKYTNEDLSVFEKSDIAPGVYDLDINLNKRKLERRNIELFLTKNKDNEDVMLPCLEKSELVAYGIKLSNDSLNKTLNGSCIDLSTVPYLTSEVDLYSNALNLSVPQASINEKKLLDFEKKYWDNGIPAMMLGYDLSQFSTYIDGKTQNNYYGNMRAKLNLGAWRYENYSVLTKNSGQNADWNTISNTLSTIIKPINSDLTMGNTYTASAMFDTVKIKGAKLSSNLQMLPSAYRAYAPSVIGLADSESIVTITQNGNVIYKKSMPAGPFNITDYYPMSSGGNLNVNVTGLDGQQKNFIVPFSSMSVFERKGNYQYSFSSGQYDGYGERDGTYVNQLDFHYGLTDFVTLSAGAQLSSPYKAYALGTGLNMGSFGAASVDMVHAKTNGLNQTFSGNSFKINYNKNILPTNTNLTIVGYKHFDDQYYSFNEAMAIEGGANSSTDKLKTEYTASISQNLPQNWGQFNLSSTMYNYRSGGDTTTMNVSYSNSYRRFSYSFYYNYNKYNKDNGQNSKAEDNNLGSNDYSIGLSISMPFDYKAVKNPAYVGYAITTDKDHNTVQNINASGVAGEFQQGSWGIYQGYDQKGNDYSGGINGSYQAPFATMNAGYSYSGNMKSLNFGMSGGIIASKYGVLLSQPIYGASALVIVDDTKGIQVQNSSSAITNDAGVALVTGLQAYRSNTIALNNSTIPDDVEIDNTIINNIVPTKDALILANFSREKGYKLLLNIKDEIGDDIPFGAQARIENGKPTTISNFGQLYMLSNQKQGNITVQWTQGEQPAACDLSFDIAQMKFISGLYMMPVICKSATKLIEMKAEIK